MRGVVGLGTGYSSTPQPLHLLVVVLHSIKSLALDMNFENEKPYDLSQDRRLHRNRNQR